MPTTRPVTAVLAVFLLVWGLCLPTGAVVRAQAIPATVDSTRSVIDYTGSATLHDWTGTSRDVDGTLLLNPQTPDSSRVVVRARVASFESGPDRRDRRMREVTEADKYPFVTFRTGTIRPTNWGKTKNGHAGRWQVRGDLTFHGQTHPVDATVDVRIQPDTVHARAQFPVSLTRFGVERPELLWTAPIGDTIRIDARIVGVVDEKKSRAVLQDERNDVTGTRRVASPDLRDVSSAAYAGRSAGLHTEVRMQPDGDRKWILALYGFAGRPTGLATDPTVRLQADGQSVTPLRVKGMTRQMDDGTTVEIVRMQLTRSAYATLARALTVSATIGSARFAPDWTARRDMRRIVETVGSPRRGAVSSRHGSKRGN